MRSAVVVFAKAPVSGRVKTRLCPPLSAEGAAELQLACLQDLWLRLGRLREVERCLCYDPPDALDLFFSWLDGVTVHLPQAGGSLGERLTAGFAALFRAGYRAVVAVGADSPDLPLTHVTRALNHLLGGAQDVVIGPAEDGGYVLIGLDRPQPDLFRNIPWSTDRVADDTRERCRQAGLRLFELPPWYDLDRPSDLHRLRATVACRPDEFPHLSRHFSSEEL